MKIRTFFVPFALAVLAHALSAQATQPSPNLRAEIAHEDSALFAAFNARDMKTFRTFFNRDLEFYQDNDGLKKYVETMNDFTHMFSQPAQLRRDLVPGSLEVYPIKGYGAIQVGSHRFCHMENGAEDCGTFKFLHVWRKTGRHWAISRVVSYAH